MIDNKLIRLRIQQTSKDIDEIKNKFDKEELTEANQRLQDFMLWLIGYLESNQEGEAKNG